MNFPEKIKSGTNQILFWLVAFVCSLIPAAAIIFVSPYKKKWWLAVMLALAGSFSGFIIPKRVWPLMLFLSVFVIPLRIDFYIYFKPTDFVQTTSYPGLPVTSFDILLFLSVLYLLLLAYQGKIKINFYPAIAVPLLLYIALSGVSMIHSKDLPLSLCAFFLILKSFFVFFFFSNRVKTREDLILITFALIAGVSMQAAIGGLQFVTNGAFLNGVFGVPEEAFRTQAQGVESISRVGGSVGHPNMLAKYLSFCIPVMMCSIFANINKWLDRLAWIGILGASLTLILTMSRGSWLALTVVMGYVCYELFQRYFRSKLKALIFVCLTLSLVLGSILGLFEEVRNRLFEDDYGAAEARIPMAQVALNIIRDHPVGGIGLDNYTTVMHSYDHTRMSQTYKFPHPVHNSYLLVAAESGIPALLVFLVVIVNSLMKVRLPPGETDARIWLFQVGCIGSLCTWLISGMFDRDFPGSNEMLWFMIALISANYRMLLSDKPAMVAEKPGFAESPGLRQEIMMRPPE